MDPVTGLRSTEPRVAVVTGAASGIGLACARTLSEDGFLVVLADIDLDTARLRAEEIGAGALALPLDVRDTASTSALADAVLARLGRVDVLVNNAGMNIGARHSAEVTDDEFDTVMSVNVRGTFMVTRAFLPALVARRGGSIINLSSIVGQRGVAFVAPYSASKFAVVGLTQAWAGELAAHDITVNSVHPGIVDTQLHTTVVREFTALMGLSFEEGWSAFGDRIPLGRLQTVDDVANVVAFLASSRARNITGSAVNVDGGLMLA